MNWFNFFSGTGSGCQNGQKWHNIFFRKKIHTLPLLGLHMIGNQFLSVVLFEKSG